MDALPIGGVLFALCALLALAPIRRPRSLAMFSWIASAAPIELPFVFMYIVVASTVPPIVDGTFVASVDWIAVVIAVLTMAALVVVTARALRARAVTEDALDGALGARWRDEIDAAIAARLRHRLPWLRILFLPWPFRPRSVERIADIPYGEHGVDNLLDVYRRRSRPGGAPTLVYFHGGRFKRGRKSFEARPLIHHLARQGWTCVSANYHLSATPAQGFPDHLIDAKKVIAWARTDGRRYGVDPTMIFVAGSSAGAHLSAMVALTANDPAWQPGFEADDTSVVAGVGLYGYYGALGSDELRPTAPGAYVSSAARPFFVIHGDHDTFTPVDGARGFVEDLRSASAQPVVYAELPGAQHSFDLFHSIRFDTTVDAIEAFAAWTRTQARRGSSTTGVGIMDAWPPTK